MNHRITRREFLKAVTVSLGTAALASCKPQILSPADVSSPTDIPPSETHLPPSTISPTIVEPSQTSASTSPEPTTTAQPDKNQPYLVVARNGEPEEMVRRAINALGGMERFVKPGAKVVIKPNICVAYHSFEYAATTNPWVVSALVKLCLDAGADKVSVFDFPFGGTPEQAYQVSGIAEVVTAAGGEMIVMPRFKFISTKIANGQDLKKAAIFEDALKADVLIDVPIAKHHSLARLTLGMKNLMGLIQDRQAIHLNVGQRLADLTSQIRPTLTVVDAVRILMDHGPTGGSLDDVKQMNTIIASQDIVAADSYAATLFGLQPEDISYIRAGAQMGLGISDLKGLNIEEINVGA